MAERILHGTGASPGVAIGPVYRLAAKPKRPTTGTIAPEAVAAEIDRLHEAAAQARRSITAARAAAAAGAGDAEAAIFDAHLLMLDDPVLLGGSEDRIRTGLVPAAVAVEQTAESIRRLFEQIEDPTLRERAVDVTDVAAQVVQALSGPEDVARGDWPPHAVVVADELRPSDMVFLDEQAAAGLAAERGGLTAHVAILARALGLPAVMGVAGLLAEANPGEVVVIDGELGEVVLSPEPERLAGYQQRQLEVQRAAVRLATRRHEPAITLDGERVAIFANIGTPDDLRAVETNGAEGIGLFRTEFLFVERAYAPDEDEQYRAYAEVARAMAGWPVVIRTLDAGGDKPVPGIPHEPEDNPFLGVRGLRLSLRHPDLFRSQLRAILRAAVDGDVWVMFPMVTTVDEVRAARAELQAVAEGLRVAGVAHRSNIPVGIMVEVPAAAIAADELIQEVDFFSLGTNDLAQYVLAADRSNQALASAYAPLDLAVLRLIEHTVTVAVAAGKHVAVCGELAGDPSAIPLLVGLGLRELSMTPASIPRAKDVIREISAREAATAARQRLGDWHT